MNKRKNSAVSTNILDNEMIVSALKKCGSYKEGGIIAYMDRLKNYIRGLNDNDINKLEKACNNKNKALIQHINALWRDPKYIKDNVRTLNDNGINKLNGICEFKNRVHWLKFAIKQVREERELAVLKEKKERRINIVDQGLGKFENYIENIAIEPEENIELPYCPIKCDRPFKKKNKNKLLHMSSG